MCAQYKDIVSNSTPAKAEDINKTHISKHTHTHSLSPMLTHTCGLTDGLVN